jgi:hypothetical protein
MPMPARLALSLAALGLAACSFSFKAGSSASNEAGKPAVQGEQAAGKPASKPIGKPGASAPTRPDAPAEPTTPTEDAGPHRTPPVEEPPPVVEPTLTAVCRVADDSLEALCHRALDPIAADDLDAWSEQLGEGIVVTRPAFRKGVHRIQGPQAVRDAATRAGGLRRMLSLRPTDRVVGTLANDCRQCRRSFVAFEANTRAGTIVVTLEMTQPPVITAVEVDSQIRRRHLEERREPTPTTLVPPAKADPAPSREIVAPTPTREQPEQ